MRVSFLGVLAGMVVLTAPMAHAQLITGFDEFDEGASAMFRQPSFSGSTSSNITGDPNLSAVSTEQAFSGDKSLKVNFAFVDGEANRWVRLTTFNTPNLPNPTIALDQAVSMKVYVASENPLGFTLGVRETGTTADIGANGGASGGIEFVGGVPSAGIGAANHVVTPGSWQDLVFMLPSEPVAPFAGATADGILTSATGKGVLEHLGIISPGSDDPVLFYIDDVTVGSAGVIPEPGTMALLATGLLPLLGLRRRK